MTIELHTGRIRLALTALLVLSSAVAVAQTPSPSSETVSWLTSDSASKTVTLRLEVTRPAGSPSATINGLRGAGAQVIVPLNWTVRWEWRSADSTAPHSLVVMAERESFRPRAGAPRSITR